ncbi:hypothetical protein FF38_06439 [Lucilia cuprina]|uniref:Uncharacterized protein n=1 Tax=Lucilia cuprina TaxID=7375 RepID=A0A0L0BQ53_LUCCU|nr:hypothetical protein FF38_06439 [Lucilia cuprina]
MATRLAIRSRTAWAGVGADFLVDDSDGVRSVIRLSTRNVPSIFEPELNRDFKVIGQKVSSWRLNAVRFSLSTNPFETRLTVDPESSRHRACLEETLTRTVGKSTKAFWRRIEVSDVDFEMEGADFEVEAEAESVLRLDEDLFSRDVEGCGEGERERLVNRSFTRRGFTWSRV